MDYVVTRHEDTIMWIKTILKGDVTVLHHLNDKDIKKMREGDRVFGVLPLHLIMRLLRKGVGYYGLIIPDIPPEKRGMELTAEEIKAYGGKILHVKGIDAEVWR